MADENRTLIETFLPVEDISEEAKKEKAGRAPTFEMHYWWTRKPLVTARAAVLGALLSSDYDITEFKRLLGLGMEKRAHNFDINPAQLEKLRQEYLKVWGTENPLVLDPFAGGGSIPFEAMRVGVDAISNDYNPVAHLIQKATLEYPRKYGEKLYKDVKKGLEWVFEETKKELESYYPMHDGLPAAAYIWAWMVRCPKCGFDNPLVGQWWLVRNEKNNVYMQPSVVGGKLNVEIKNGTDVPEGTCTGGDGKCLSCGSIIQNSAVKKDIVEREEERLLAVVLTKSKGKEYVLPSKEDFDGFQKAKEEVTLNWDKWLKDNLIPLEEMPEDTRGSISAKLYLKYWYKLLNPRQQLLFVTLLKKMKEYARIVSNKHDSEFGEAVASYISFILGKHIDYNCRSTTWIRSKELISSTTGRRGSAMMWDHAEVNPFVKGSGTLISVNNAILVGLKYSMDRLIDRGNIRVMIGSITSLKESVNILVTDPPYFDDVRYAEFSEFFYVWERKALEGFHDLGDVQSQKICLSAAAIEPENFSKNYSNSPASACMIA
jgi:adenine-specific DNA methylase